MTWKNTELVKIDQKPNIKHQSKWRIFVTGILVPLISINFFEQFGFVNLVVLFIIMEILLFGLKNMIQERFSTETPPKSKNIVEKLFDLADSAQIILRDFTIQISAYITYFALKYIILYLFGL